jgi:uncharacterized membrane protein
MAPLFVLLGLFTLFRIIDFLPLAAQLGWWTALRLALAGMFLLTASAHWGRRRGDLIRMIPPIFPAPALLVTLTGVMEIAGAASLLAAPLAPYAAASLSLLLVAVFPANVHAARNRLAIGGRQVLGLFARTVLQFVFIGAAAAVHFGAPS